MRPDWIIYKTNSISYRSFRRGIERAYGFELLKEIVTLVIYQDKGGEIFHFYFPDCLHTQLGIFEALYLLDAVLCQNSSRAAYTAQIETAVLFAGIGHLFAAVSGLLT